jgi:hypothetical protein
VDPVVDLFFELGFVDEAVDLQGAEKVADALSYVASRSRSFVVAAGGRLSFCILLWLNCLKGNFCSIGCSMKKRPRVQFDQVVPYFIENPLAGDFAKIQCNQLEHRI